MTKATMPEPAGFIKPYSLRSLEGLSDQGLIYTEIRRRGDDERTIPIFTTDQAEAYKDACVREALEEAAHIVDANAADCTGRIRKGLLRSNAQAIRALMTTEN